MDNVKIKLILVYFQLCGFCHFTCLEQHIDKKTMCIIFILICVHSIILVSIISLAVIYFDSIFISHPLISDSLDILNSMLPIFSQFIIIIESIRNISRKDQFWARIRYIDRLLLETSNQIKQMANNIFVMKCALLFATLTIIDVFVFIHIASDVHWRNHILISYYTCVIYRSKVLFCVLFIDALKYRIIMLNKRLKDVQNGAQNQRNLMRCCKRAHEMLWLCVQDINRSFGMHFKISFKFIFNSKIK